MHGKCDLYRADRRGLFDASGAAIRTAPHPSRRARADETLAPTRSSDAPRPLRPALRRSQTPEPEFLTRPTSKRSRNRNPTITTGTPSPFTTAVCKHWPLEEETPEPEAVVPLRNAVDQPRRTGLIRQQDSQPGKSCAAAQPAAAIRMKANCVLFSGGTYGGGRFVCLHTDFSARPERSEHRPQFTRRLPQTPTPHPNPRRFALPFSPVSRAPLRTANPPPNAAPQPPPVFHVAHTSGPPRAHLPLRASTLARAFYAAHAVSRTAARTTQEFADFTANSAPQLWPAYLCGTKN